MKVITFGEIMLRLSPNNNLRFFQEPELEATFGGGEANVAVSLANYGLETSFVTKLPDNDIGQNAINSIRYFGVNTNHIVRGGDRVGIYYLEKGASQRASNVIYDRKYSSISQATITDFDWDAIFEDADWFHFTGITPALGQNVVDICLLALKKAKQHNVKVSCDLNYRKKLWTTTEAQDTMMTLAPYIDVLIANEEDAEKVFGIHAKDSDVSGGRINRSAYESVAQQLSNKFNFDYVAITLRESINANINNWSGMLYHQDKSYFSPVHNINIVDRVGGGDSFGGGLIYALLNGYEPQRAIDFAVAASCLKHSIQGDFNRVSVAEVDALVDGDGTGRVKR